MPDGPEARRGMRRRRGLAVPVVLMTLSMLCAGCGFAAGGTNSAAVPAPIDPGKLRIGYAEPNAVMTVLREKGELSGRLADLSVTPEWHAFADEAEALTALREGRIDLAATGDAVPAFLLKEGDPVVYLAAEPSNPAAYAVVVPLESDILNVSDLKGKKIAYPRYANEHLLLMQMADRAGLPLADMKLAPVAPSAMERSFAERKADAWAVAEPVLSRLQSSGVRIVADGTGLVATRDVYLANARYYRERKEVLDAALDAILRQEDWFGSDVHGAAEWLSARTEVEHIEWLAVFERKLFGIAPLLESIAKEEQNVVDTLVRLKGRKETYAVPDFLPDPQT